MERLMKFLKESHHWQHLVGGLAVGFVLGLPSAVLAACCLEYKDKAYGCVWDWTDWWLTTGGGLAGSLLMMALKQII